MVLSEALHTEPTCLIVFPGILLNQWALRLFLSAWLFAVVVFVFWVCRMTKHLTHVTALEELGTFHGAASLWCASLEVVST